MKCNPDRFIEALIAVEMMEMHHQQAVIKEKQRKQAETCVVTVSRDFGSMGKLVAQQLADTLRLRCCDRYILQEVARRAHVDEELVSVLDEHVSKINGHWWQHLLQKEVFSYEDYYQYLVKTILAVSRTGGVIIGRGANLILGEKRAFRVRITGSVEKCAERVASREEIDIKAATKLVHEVNNERAEYIKKLYDTDINEPSNYDLVLNSDRYNKEQIVELIRESMKKAGYILPDESQTQRLWIESP